jgi:hypothetical protein
MATSAKLRMGTTVETQTEWSWIQDMALMDRIRKGNFPIVIATPDDDKEALR